MKFKCVACSYVYDEEKEGVKFKKLPKDWRCPQCGAPKSAFVPLAEEAQTDPGRGKLF